MSRRRWRAGQSDDVRNCAWNQRHLKALARYTFNFRNAPRGCAFMPVGWAKDTLPPRRERESRVGRRAGMHKSGGASWVGSAGMLDGLRPPWAGMHAMAGAYDVQVLAIVANQTKGDRRIAGFFALLLLLR